MLKKLALASLGLLFLGSPLLASAATECLQLNRTLSRGSTGTDVSSLQTFLIAQNHLAAGNVTGYFGPLTEGAVQRFQCAQGIVCSGTPTTTGYGVVGPRTRTAIKNVSCGDQPPPPPPPPTTISCTLTTNDPIIYSGESTYISWTSQGATTGNIQPSIGQVSTSGTRSVSPTQTTTYSGIFYGATGQGIVVATCQTTVTVLGDTPPTCTPEAPQTQTLSCASGQTGSIIQTRNSSCPGPTWSGWTTTSNTCTSVPQPLSCTFNGQTVAHGSSVTAYQASTATQCVSEQRTCNNGILSGSYTYNSCTVGGGGGTTSNTSCSYKGASYAEGQTVNAPSLTTNFSTIDVPLLCDNGSWVLSSIGNNTQFLGANACQSYYWSAATAADLGCSSTGYPQFLTVTPSRHGNASFTVTITTEYSDCAPTPIGFNCAASTLSWGDGATENYPGTSNNMALTHTSTHTYTAPGSYVISVPGGPSGYYLTGLVPRPRIQNSASIRVIGTTASATTNSNLANALTALESALKALIAKLGQ